MKFIALFNLKDNVDQAKLAEVIARRIDYVHPVKTIAEYHSPRKRPVSSPSTRLTIANG